MCELQEENDSVGAEYFVDNKEQGAKILRRNNRDREMGEGKKESGRKNRLQTNEWIEGIGEEKKTDASWFKSINFD